MLDGPHFIAYVGHKHKYKVEALKLENKEKTSKSGPRRRNGR
jgi:hypothetical protein